jgi:signal transduction histidine kinase
MRHRGSGGSGTAGNGWIEVRDTGAGITPIPPEELPRVWERFYRGDQARTRDAQGAASGLALVKKLTEEMDGRVAVKRRVGEGSVFTVWLPRHSGRRT